MYLTPDNTFLIVVAEPLDFSISANQSSQDQENDVEAMNNDGETPNRIHRPESFS